GRGSLAAGARLARPAARGARARHDPADRGELRPGHGDRPGRGADAALAVEGPLRGGPGLRLADPRHPAAGAAVHRLLRAPLARPDDRHLPRRRHRLQPQRGRVRLRGGAGLDPRGPARAVGGGGHRRPGLHGHAAADRAAAGHAGGRPAAVEHAHLAGQGHLAGFGGPLHRPLPGRPADRRAHLRVLPRLLRGRRVLLGDLPGALGRAGAPGDPPRPVRGRV
ncbi:MAG: L-cystine ABC transporter, permease protein TcyB, partial [uncultured Quadrisphaera sp.]